ncbi:hypothetical protein NSMM_150075 [Nitrosomonas mobilis]|uniref:Uncharacterized protein n=1 Tax=Nitrosomonas mobilis TaxID=51642 RepID=A0A1G5SBG3_9PROT|nr:hypothetical protein NSMM_150075 [Nitrosomonas mobilis]
MRKWNRRLPSKCPNFPTLTNELFQQLLPNKPSCTRYRNKASHEKRAELKISIEQLFY